jgi:hypothetical protein
MANPSPPLKHLVDLTVHERHLIELNPNRKVATKGGSMPGIFHRWVPLGRSPGRIAISGFRPLGVTCHLFFFLDIWYFRRTGRTFADVI